MKQQSPQQGSQKLRPRARLLRTFGDELISSEVVALIELVKNAYDADATRVAIRFSDVLSKGTGHIEVIDNGNGMSLATVTGAWMEPATLFKKHDTRSPRFRRRVTGEKGIGRFAVSKLAEHLQLVSRTLDSQDEVQALFDWTQFDDEEKYLDEILALWEQGPAKEITPGGAIEALWEPTEEHTPLESCHGTILRMEGLRDTWSEDRFKALHTVLSRLVPPQLRNAHVGKIDEFLIRLDLPAAYGSFGGVVGPSEVLQNPPYEISGNVRSDGSYELDVLIQGTAEKLTGKFQLKNGRPPGCGPFYVELRAWDRESKDLAPLIQAFHSTLKDVRGELDRVAGVNIYRDGFRVLPYGEPKNDWLRLDVRRVNNPTLRLSNNQVLGFLLISADQNPHLRDQSNREGLIESQAVEDFRKLVEMVMNEVEARRWTFRHPPHPKIEREQRKSLFSDFNLHNLRMSVRAKRPEDKELFSLIEAAEEEITVKVEEVQQVLARYHRLATLGGLVDTVLHDGRAPLAKIRNESGLLLRDLEREKSNFPKVLADTRAGLQMILTQSDVLQTVFRKIEPFAGRKRGRPAKVLIEQVIADAFAVFDREIAEYGIDTLLPASKTEVTVDSAELQEVLINLIQNSIYWLQKKSQDERKIQVGITRTDGALEIIFCDSGPGIPPQYRESIFEPYFSTKPDGIGLGLAIAGEVLKDYYDGDLELMDSGPLDGACFRIVLRKRV